MHIRDATISNLLPRIIRIILIVTDAKDGPMCAENIGKDDK